MRRGGKLEAMLPANDHGRCPICAQPGVADYRPFCSRRCANIDLARWLGGTYVIPGPVDEDEDGDGARDPSEGGSGGTGQGNGEKGRSDADA